MKKTLEIEVEKIIKPIRTSDGAGVKLKRFKSPTWGP